MQCVNMCFHRKCRLEEMAMITDQKLDIILAAFEGFKELQQKNYKTLEEMNQKLHEFKADLEATKES